MANRAAIVGNGVPVIGGPWACRSPEVLGCLGSAVFWRAFILRQRGRAFRLGWVSGLWVEVNVWLDCGGLKYGNKEA